jgi:hypothetical protein
VAERHHETQDLALDRPEIRFALPREEVGDGRALAGFDQLVDVFSAPPETARDPARDGGLPAYEATR